MVLVNICVMIIKDNFLKLDEFLKLQEFVLSNEFPWFYSDRVSLPPDEFNIIDDAARETDGFYHLLYTDDNSNQNVYMKHFQLFFEKLTQEFGYTSDSLIRARLGLKMPKVNHKIENYNLPHIDYHFPHDTIIFYLNASDGNTRMFDQYGEENKETLKFTVKEEIEPIQNRLLLFNGLQYHTASNPINSSRRIVLNLNLKCK